MKRTLLGLLLGSTMLLTAQVPIFEFKFDQTVTDESGLNTLTPSTGSILYTSDRYGNSNGALRLDGSVFLQAYSVNLGMLPQGTSARSISVWVKYNLIDNPSSTTLDLVNYGTNNVGQMFGIQQRSPFMRVYGYVEDFDSPWTATNGYGYFGWYHYVATFDGTTANLYRNGRLVASGNPTSWNTTGTTMSLGMNSTNNNGAKDLAYDDLKIYDIALSESQIQAMYTDQAPFDGTDLVAYFPFDNSYDSQDGNHTFGQLSPSVTNTGSFVSGVHGDAINFDGQGGVKNSSLDTEVNSDNVTICYWQRRNGAITHTYETSMEAFGGIYTRQINDSYDYDQYGMNISNSSMTNIETYAPFAMQGIWRHHAIVFEFDGVDRSYKYYVDGELTTEMLLPTGATWTRSIADFYMGCGNNLSVPFTAKMVTDVDFDDLMIFNRVLSQDELLAVRYQQPDLCPSGNVVITNQVDADALANCSHITGNLDIAADIDFTPLQGITEVDGFVRLRDMSVSVAGVLPNLHTVGSLVSFENNSAQSLGGFENLTIVAGVQVYDNPGLVEVTGFDNLASFNGALKFQQNTMLSNVTAFSALTSIGSLELISNSVLPNVNFLTNLTELNGNLFIQFNPGLTSSAFPNNVLLNWSNPAVIRYESNINLVDISNVEFIANAQIDDFYLISNNNLTTVNLTFNGGVSGVGDLWITQNYSLPNLNFLSSVISCGEFRVQFSSAITDLSGIENLISVSSFNINSNDALISLFGVSSGSLNVNGGLVSITGNSVLSGISNLNSINITTIGSLKLQNNVLLETCHETWVCDYLSSSTSNATISGNATGCEDVNVVEQACNGQSSLINENQFGIEVYPNPTSGLVNFSEKVNVTLYNVVGEIIMTHKDVRYIDLGSFSKGSYVLKIESVEGHLTKKVLLN